MANRVTAPRLDPRRMAFTAADSVGLSALSDAATRGRFESYVDRSGLDECHAWRGPRNGDTGQFSLWADGARRIVSAQRFEFASHAGPIPKGHLVRRQCETPACVNFKHLAAVLPVVATATTLAQGLNFYARKTECVNGHPFDARNTGRTKTGTRYCLACWAANQRASNAKRDHRGEYRTVVADPARRAHRLKTMREINRRYRDRRRRNVRQETAA